MPDLTDKAPGPRSFERGRKRKEMSKRKGKRGSVLQAPRSSQKGCSLCLGGGKKLAHSDRKGGGIKPQA